MEKAPRIPEGIREGIESAITMLADSRPSAEGKGEWLPTGYVRINEDVVVNVTNGDTLMSRHM